jgi:hypothetical protein
VARGNLPLTLWRHSIMDILGGHLLHDHFARQLFGGDYTRDDDPPTPSKEPAPDKERGGPLDPNSFNDDRAPPKMPPVKPHPQGIPPRPDTPMLMEPQSLQVTRQPLMPGEMPAELLPGENGKPPAPLPMGMPPPRMPGMMPMPRMPGTMQPQQTRAPGMPGLGPQRSAPPAPGLKPAPKSPSLRSPKPVSQSPSSKPPHQQSAPKSKPSPSKEKAPPKAAARFTYADYDFLNSAGDDRIGLGPMQPPAQPAPSVAPPPPSARRR